MVFEIKKPRMSVRERAKRGDEILAAGRMKDEHEKKKGLAESRIVANDVTKTQNDDANNYMEYDDLVGKPKWLVIHAAELYDINPNLIGFRDPAEWRRIKNDDIVFYYSTSPDMKIMGIYKVVRSRESIDINFCLTKDDGRTERLRYQHELKLVNALQRYFGTDEHTRLSFYHLLKNPRRWDNEHVFKMSQGDMQLIMKSN
jgi:predicted RNA-binding protein with PUA-like domain